MIDNIVSPVGNSIGNGDGSGYGLGSRFANPYGRNYGDGGFSNLCARGYGNNYNCASNPVGTITLTTKTRRR